MADREDTEIFHECDICGMEFAGSGAIGAAANHLLSEDCQDER